MRNTTCTTEDGYSIRWDTDRDGDFTDEPAQIATRNEACNCILDAGRLHVVGAVDAPETQVFNVQVTNECTGENTYGAFKIFVHDFEPNDNPSTWNHADPNQRSLTSAQLRIMAESALQEHLWFAHRSMQNHAATGKNMTAIAPGNATGLTLQLFSANGRYPAYPPQAVLTGTAPCTSNADCAPGSSAGVGREECVRSQCLPAGFQESNDQRYLADPYADSALRITNFFTQAAVAGGRRHR